MAATASTPKRPSDDRRDNLSETLSVPLVSNFFPLDSYYGAADKVYDSFQVALEQVLKNKKNKTVSTDQPPDPAADAALDDAYVYGKRYCTFCLDALPKHNYHGTPKYHALHKRHTIQVQKVLNAIESVVMVQMDDYERIKQRLFEQEQARLAAARKAAAERERLAAERRQQARLDELQRRIAQQKQDSLKKQKQQSSSSSDLKDESSTEASAMSKLQLLLPPAASHSQSSSSSSLPRIQRDPSGEEPDDDQLPAPGKPSTKYSMPLSSDEDDDDGNGAYSGVALPPPLLPPPPASTNGGAAAAAVPPSYQQIVAQRNKRYTGSNLMWDPNAAAKHMPDHFINGMRVQPSAPPTSDTNALSLPPPPAYPGAPAAALQPYQPQPAAPIKPPQLQRKVPLAELQKQYAATYQRYLKQGKIRVTPLDTYQGRYSASTNGCTVISALVASAHLRASSSRGQGVTDAAICQVIDQQCGPLLRQIRSKLGLGGHALIIPSDVHDHLVDHKLLQQDKFVGAAGGNILDPEHLGSFLKLLSVGETGDLGTAPAAATLFFREHVISIVKKVSPTTGQTLSYDLIDSLPSLSIQGRSRASRTVCRDFDALTVLLQWYASRKFSAAQCREVDRNDWNDSMADLDPRVFQGFVWANAPVQ